MVCSLVASLACVLAILLTGRIVVGQPNVGISRVALKDVAALRIRVVSVNCRDSFIPILDNYLSCQPSFPCLDGYLRAFALFNGSWSSVLDAVTAQACSSSSALAKIEVNERVHVEGKDGFSVVAIEVTEESYTVLPGVVFDGVADLAAPQRMIDYINNLPSNTIVAVTFQQARGDFKFENINRALQLIGASNASLRNDMAYTLLGYKSAGHSYPEWTQEKLVARTSPLPAVSDTGVLIFQTKAKSEGATCTPVKAGLGTALAVSLTLQVVGLALLVYWYKQGKLKLVRSGKSETPISISQPFDAVKEGDASFREKSSSLRPHQNGSIANSYASVAGGNQFSAGKTEEETATADEVLDQDRQHHLSIYDNPKASATNTQSSNTGSTESPHETTDYVNPRSLVKDSTLPSAATEESPLEDRVHGSSRDSIYENVVVS